MSQTERHDGERLCDYISRITQRQLTMETSLEDNFHKCHQQDQSPLFNHLPKEVRDLIFSFATEQYEDMDRRYRETAYYYRPGHRGPLKTSTSLLATCRRIWLETSQLPMRKTKVTMWFEENRGPPLSEHPKYEFSVDWTVLNKQNFSTLHIFGQKHMLDRMFSGARMNWAHTKMETKVLRVTMRHTDWNRWEDPLPLDFNHQWLQRALDSPHLSAVEVFQLELETLEKYSDQLQDIVDRAKNMKGAPRPSDPITEMKISEDPYFWHWTGPPNIGEETHAAHAGMDRLEYRIAVLTWKATRSETGTVISPAVDNTAGRVNLFNDPQRIRGPPGPRPLRMADFATRRGLAQNGWQSMQFPFAQYMVAVQSLAVSQAEEYRRFQMFEEVFADVRARELQEQWKAQGSLLKFVQDTDSTCYTSDESTQQSSAGFLMSMNEHINSVRFDQLVCPADPSWPPGQLRTWLARHGYAPQWYDALQHLDLHGFNVVDTIARSRARGTGFVPRTLVPQVERGYAAAGVAYRAYDVHREGHRLRDRMRELVKNWYVPAEKKYAAHVTPWQLFDAASDLLEHPVR